MGLRASSVLDPRELGMTWSPLGMLRPRALLTLRAMLVPEADPASDPDVPGMLLD